MKPAAFDYFRPASLEEALRRLDDLGPQAKVIAGGQSLGPMMNMRLATPAQLIDLNDLTELGYVREAGDWLQVGGLTRHHAVAESPLAWRHCPLLAQAAQTIGHYAIRQRGTLGGSLAHADPAAQLALVAATLGARLNLVRRGSQRQVEAADFFVGAMITALGPQELILSVEFPKALPGEAAAYRLFNRRHGDYAIVAVATTVRVEQGKVAHLRLGVGGAGPVPQRLDSLAQAFCGFAPSGSWIAQVAAAAAQAVQVEDDGRVPALYRQELTRALVADALRSATGPLAGDGA